MNVSNRCWPNARPAPLLAFLAIFACAVAINFSYSALTPASTVATLDADEQEYYALAQQLLDGEYQHQSRRVLGHVVLLAAAMSLGENKLALAHTATTLLFSLSAPLVYLLARRTLGHDGVAILAGFVVACWPPFIFYSATLYSETSALPLFLLFLTALPIGTDKRKPKSRWIAAGIVLGLCMHLRPMYLLYLPFAVLVIFIERRTLLASARSALLVLGGIGVVILPWSLATSLEEGGLILLSTNGGETIAGGLNPRLTEMGYTVTTAPDGRQTWYGPGKWLNDSGYLSSEEQKLSALTKDSLLKERTLHWMASNPWDAARLQLVKIAYMWGFYPFVSNGLILLFFGNIPILLLLGLGALSLHRFRNQLGHLARFWTLPLFVTLVACISWGSWRFRQPGDVGLIVLATMYVWDLFSPLNLDGRRSHPLTPDCDARRSSNSPITIPTASSENSC